MKNLARRLFRSFGLEVRKIKDWQPPPDISETDAAIIRKVSDYTMTSTERQIALLDAVRHITTTGVPGCYVECGTWRGGSSMAAALELIRIGDTSRDLFLYDTFEGMSPPTDADRTVYGHGARELLNGSKPTLGVDLWCWSPLEDVRRNMESTGYPKEKIHLVKGKIEDTVPELAPQEPIALLRLDTDWYESTKHELDHLYPLLSPGGIMIIDDYGHWQGARKAVDEWLSQQQPRPFLHRIDYTGRLLVKP